MFDNYLKYIFRIIIKEKEILNKLHDKKTVLQYELDRLLEKIEKNYEILEEEIRHLNNYQISMVGTSTDGKTFTATEGKDYIAVTHAGRQTLNGLQATAYCRVRQVGDDFMRAQRQRDVLAAIMEKAKQSSQSQRMICVKYRPSLCTIRKRDPSKTKPHCTNVAFHSVEQYHHGKNKDHPRQATQENLDQKTLPGGNM